MTALCNIVLWTVSILYIAEDGWGGRPMNPRGLGTDLRQGLEEQRIILQVAVYLLDYYTYARKLRASIT